MADVEEKLLSMLFPVEDENSALDPSDERYQQYVSYLTSLPLDALRREPLELAAESAAVRVEMEELAYRHYPSFIATAQCVRRVNTDMRAVSTAVKEMQTHIPNLSASCKEFTPRARQLAEERELNKLTLERYNQLLELLEIPNWMSECVHHGYYEEGLELRAFAKRFRQRHPNLSIAQSIGDDVDRLSEALLAQLLRRLSEEGQLPEFLRMIGFLRRLEVFSERELRLAFLHSRDCWLRRNISVIPTQNAYLFLDKLTHISRLHLFDTITHYRAIFSDDSKEGGANEGGILASWVQYKLEYYLDKLSTYLPRIADSEKLSKLLDQWMYFGMSLSRVGVDFRGLLPSVFESYLLQQFKHHMDDALTAFELSIQSKKFYSSYNPDLYPPLILEKQDPFAPPRKLIAYPPLAELTNAFLDALNSLWKIAPITLQNPLSISVQETLKRIVAIIRSVRGELMMNSERERQYFEFCKMMAETLVPYLTQCFAHLFNASPSSIDFVSVCKPLERLYSKLLSAPAPSAPKSSPAPTSSSASAAPADAAFDGPSSVGAESGTRASWVDTSAPAAASQSHDI